MHGNIWQHQFIPEKHSNLYFSPISLCCLHCSNKATWLTSKQCVCPNNLLVQVGLIQPTFSYYITSYSSQVVEHFSITWSVININMIKEIFIFSINNWSVRHNISCDNPENYAAILYPLFTEENFRWWDFPILNFLEI